MPYTSPTVGLYFFAADYIKFVKNLSYYLSLDIQFIKIEKSKNFSKKDYERYSCPIGVLGDVEIIFLHYKSEDEAKDKWNRRIERINWDNLIVKFNDQNNCNKDMIYEFDELPYKNKICFIANKLDGVKSSIVMTEYSGNEYVVNDTTKYTRYINITTWLNNHVSS